MHRISFLEPRALLFRTALRLPGVGGGCVRRKIPQLFHQEQIRDTSILSQFSGWGGLDPPSQVLFKMRFLKVRNGKFARPGSLNLPNLLIIDL